MSAEHTPAEMLAHYWCADQARGRHGIFEFEPDERYRQIATERAERVIAALAKAGYAVVELPEPIEDKWGNPDFSNEHIRLTVFSGGCTQLETPEYFGVNVGIHPFQLRDLAARCLAAANRAEAQA